MAERNYVAFVSYRHVTRDAAIAKAVHSMIEEYVVPKALRRDGSKRLGVVFRDEEELTASSNLSESICQALDASEHLVVICSPQALESVWVQREVNYFLAHHDRKNVFAVLAGGEPDTAFPKALVEVPDEATGEMQQVEPLAIDARGDTLQIARHQLKKQIRKLFAAMLHCPYDALVAREKRRQARRRSMIAAVASAVLLAFAALMLVKNMQLEAKNEQLQQMTNEALMRESELLIAKAEESLAQSDRSGAVAAAVAALPSEALDRPYLPAAEKALFAAVNPFAASSFMAIRAEYTYATPVEQMLLTKDGSALVTMDSYGLIRCRELDGGAIRWEYLLPQKEGGVDTIYKDLWLASSGDGTLVIAGNESTVAAVDVQTGRMRWIHQDTKYLPHTYLISDSGETVACVSQRSYSDPYTLLAIRAADGAVVADVEIEGAAESGMADFDVGGGDLGWGRFLDETHVVVPAELGYTHRPVVYALDLEAGSCRVAAEPYEEDWYQSHSLMGALVMQDSVLLLLPDGMQAMTAWCISLSDGAVRWQTTLETMGFMSFNDEVFAVECDDSVVLGLNREVMVVRKEDGTIRTHTDLDAELLAMWPVEPLSFGYVQEDGYYALAWENVYGLNDSNGRGLALNLGKTDGVAVLRNGLVVRDASGAVAGLTMENGGGLVAARSAEDPCLITVFRTAPTVTQPQQVRLEGSASLISGGIAMGHCDADTIVLGPVSSKGDYRALLFNTKELRFEGSIPVTSMLDRDGEVLADGSGAVVNVSSEGIVAMDASGGKQMLCAVDSLAGMSWTVTKAGDRVLSAVCDESTLRWWLDTAEAGSVALPEGMNWSHTDYGGIYRMLHAGKNGRVLLSSFSTQDSHAMEAFMVFHPESGAWSRVTDRAMGRSDRTVALAEEKDLFAVYDADMTIRVYDVRRDKLTAAIETGLPAGSIKQMRFGLGDTHLLLYTDAEQVYVYELATGKMTYTTLMGDSLRELLSWEDEGRVFIALEDRCVCLNRSTWSELFTVYNFIWYDPESNHLITSGYLGDSVMVYQVPTTEELLAWADLLLGR